jgi:hypothetical protein
MEGREFVDWCTVFCVCMLNCSVVVVHNPEQHNKSLADSACKEYMETLSVAWISLNI